ncbi:hypothetical protein [Streptomyces sp. M41(2017)]|uniref:hypothetical protein n=1 Tax=Actinomycetes TaxID=1760 RepID=UPI001F4E934A|nr:hypothetical protein [Streptomyces sp. M41(2017)]
MMFVYLFAVAGLILSILLIAMGNSGGWILLTLTACITGAVYMFVGNIRKRQPR